MCFPVNSRTVSTAVLRAYALGLALLLTACVAPIPIKDQAPKVSYSAREKVAVVVIDTRSIVKEEGKPPTVIGHAHFLYGIPVHMDVYPWVALKEEKTLTLAQWVEQRIAEGLQASGASVVRVEAGAHADAESAKRAARGLGADRILLIALDDWFVDINLNWVGSFELAWGYTVEITDGAATQIVTFKDSGTDVVKLHGSDSGRNQVTAASRERLQKLMERPEVRSAISTKTTAAKSAPLAPIGGTQWH